MEAKNIWFDLSGWIMLNNKDRKQAFWNVLLGVACGVTIACWFNPTVHKAQGGYVLYSHDTPVYFIECL